MKNLLSIKAILIILSLALSSIAFSAEPQMMLYKKSSKGRKIASASKAKSENLKSYEINNGEMIKLYAFKTEKKALKKIEKKFDRNLDKKLLQNMTVEVFAENKMKKQAVSL
ncbi:MAG: hypothetical protein K2Q18_07865 [Bdellovibrionales bacterium]|nr:hypothetical protein [Bdellovibrionales bacterium]